VMRVIVEAKDQATVQKHIATMSNIIVAKAFIH
jgi:hypothetical protein